MQSSACSKVVNFKWDIRQVHNSSMYTPYMTTNGNFTMSPQAQQLESGATEASLSTILSNPKNVTIIASVSATVGIVLLSIVCIFYVLRRKRASENSSNVTISKRIAATSNKPPNQAGVIQKENIEFVLPYTSAEPTEEEASEQEVGNYRYSYIHGTPGGLLLAVPNQPRNTINPFSIAPALYLTSEGEEQNIWSPTNTRLGKIGFSLRYNTPEKQLLITVLGASFFPNKRRKTVTHLHIKVTILPDKHPKFFTKIQKNTCDPVYNEVFVINLQPEEAYAKILKITMCDFDKFSRRIAMGHVFLPLKNLGINEIGTNGTVLLGEVWKNLVPKYLESEEVRGEISLSLCYNSDIRNLRLGIHKVKNLNIGEDEKEIVSLYAKVTLFEDGRVIKTRKTSAKRKTFEPDFAETFNIKVSRDRVQNVFCVISVCGRNRYAARKVIGRTQIGPYTLVSGPGADHWNDAFQSPKSTVTQWHIFR